MTQSVPATPPTKESDEIVATPNPGGVAVNSSPSIIEECDDFVAVKDSSGKSYWVTAIVVSVIVHIVILAICAVSRGATVVFEGQIGGKRQVIMQLVEHGGRGKDASATPQDIEPADVSPTRIHPLTNPQLTRDDAIELATPELSKPMDLDIPRLDRSVPESPPAQDQSAQSLARAELSSPQIEGIPEVESAAYLADRPAPRGGGAPTIGFGSRTEPVYPRNLWLQRITGEVELLVKLGTDGRPTSVTISKSSGHAEFDQSAIEAVRQWRARPVLREGKPVEQEVIIPISFRIRTGR